MKINKIKSKDMSPGDVVRRVLKNKRPGAFDACIVREVDDEVVTLYRVYAIAHLTLCLGIIPYISTEEYIVPRDSNMVYELIESTEFE